MINVYGLRIGNKILSPFGAVETVFEISDNTNRGEFNQKGYEHLILVKENGNQYKPIELGLGIPLSGEWLLRMGANHIGKGTDLFNLHGFSILKEESDCRIIYKEQYINHLKYVHQLQNFIFAILGTELTIKP